MAIKEQSCGKCHFMWQPKVVEGVMYIHCLLDRKLHSADDICKHWEKIISMHENQRLEEARIKKREIASDKRHLKGIIFGAVIGILSTVTGGILVWLATYYLPKLLP